MQDVSEFETNVPRSFRPIEPPAPFLPPQPHHFGPRGGPDSHFRPGAQGHVFHGPPRGFDEHMPRFPHPSNQPNSQGPDQTGFGSQERRNDGSFQRYSERGGNQGRPQDRDQHWEQKSTGGPRSYWDNRERQEDGNAEEWSQSQAGDNKASEYSQSATTDSQSPVTRPEGGLLPPPTGQMTPQTQNDYRRGDKRPWETPHSEENRYQYQERHEGPSPGQTGYSNRSYHEGNREFRPRGTGSRGGRRGQWRGAR